MHSEGRTREEIFAAMKRRETYGTSGARILLWFNTKDGTPMGSTTKTAKSPVFEVKAVGSYKQKPGCPQDAADALGADRIHKLCASAMIAAMVAALSSPIRNMPRAIAWRLIMYALFKSRPKRSMPIICAAITTMKAIASK